MKDSDVQWVVKHYPLVMDCDPPMRRSDCLAWLRRHDYAPPRKSACLGCPFHDNAEWREIRKDPDEWSDVVAFDAHIRDRDTLRGQAFLHPSRTPLDDALGVDETPSLWANECEGMCGV